MGSQGRPHWHRVILPPPGYFRCPGAGCGAGAGPGPGRGEAAVQEPRGGGTPEHSSPGAAMEEAQRLLTVSVWKLYRCRLQRGGLRLHRSLQLSLLVRAARHSYLTARAAAEPGPTAGNPLGMAPGDPHRGDLPRTPSPDPRSTRDRGDPASPDPRSTRDRADPASPDPRSTRDRADPASPDPRSTRDGEDPASPDPRSTRDRADPASPDPRSTRDREDPASPDPRSTQGPANRDQPQDSPSWYRAPPSSPRPPPPPRDPPSAPSVAPPPEPASPGAAPVARVGRKRRSSGSTGPGPVPVPSKRARLEAEEPPLAPGPPGRCSGPPAAAFAFLVRAVGAC
ncbi:immediate early response gene 2 protein [Strigops habroptila]|nr:immediate early response gene 2 protein [Strigops habroptila]